MYSTMLKFGPGMLSEEFVKQYIFEYGEKKFQKIVEVVQTSQKIKEYLNNVIASSVTPSAKGLQNLLNSHPYFLFAKEETICVGCLGVITRWEGMYYIKTGSHYDGRYDELVTEVMVSVIDQCQSLKYVQSDNFFKRFFKRLKEIEMSAEQ